MSRSFDTTATYITRTGLAGTPARTAYTLGGWFLLPSSAPGANAYLFTVGSGGFSATLGMLRYNQPTGAFRIGHDNNFVDFGTSPAFNQWVYFFLQNDATNLKGGWKRIADSSFTTVSLAELGTGTLSAVQVLGSPFGNAMLARLFRFSFWGEAVTEANLLTAAATDLGYSTNINSHLPLTDGIASPWDDTSGNSRNWTLSGSTTNQTDPSLSSDVTVAASGSASTSGHGIQVPNFSIPL